MITKFSIEGRLSDFQREQDMSVEFFCALLPEGTISVSRLRQALSGIKPLENTYHDTIDRLLRELKEISAEHAPVLVRWEKPQLYRQILDMRRGTPRPEAYAVQVGDQYFVGCTPSRLLGTPEIHMTFQHPQATSMTPELARQVAEKLQSRGHKAQVVKALFAEANAALELNDVWYEPVPVTEKV
jgi:hypothetical protein